MKLKPIYYKHYKIIIERETSYRATPTYFANIYNSQGKNVFTRSNVHSHTKTKIIKSVKSTIDFAERHGWARVYTSGVIV